MPHLQWICYADVLHQFNLDSVWFYTYHKLSLFFSSKRIYHTFAFLSEIRFLKLLQCQTLLFICLALDPSNCDFFILRSCVFYWFSLMMYSFYYFMLCLTVERRENKYFVVPWISVWKCLVLIAKMQSFIQFGCYIERSAWVGEKK